MCYTGIMTRPKKDSSFDIINFNIDPLAASEWETFKVLNARGLVKFLHHTACSRCKEESGSSPYAIFNVWTDQGDKT
jgi:hypothetical protein